MADEKTTGLQDHINSAEEEPNAHNIYSNFYLSNEVEDQYDSHLSLQQFCTVDNTLEGTAGMERRINVYSAIVDGQTKGVENLMTSRWLDWKQPNADRATEKLDTGAGNSKSILVQYTPETYRIMMGQNKFSYYDEQAMTDPQLVLVGTKHMGVDLFNFVNYYIFEEFKKATLEVKTQAFDFAAFADAVALLDIESTDNDPQDVASRCFAFISPSDMASVRKSLADTLKYVEAFARTGYVGTVAGVNLYTKKDADKGTIIVATKEAVTLFNKKGTEIEQQRDPNTRCNTIYSRKYFLAAMTDKTKAVKIALESAEEVTPSSVTGISADTTASVTVGSKKKVNVSVTGTGDYDKTFTGKSDDETKATVESDEVTGVSAGTANITWTATGDTSKTATTAVTVTAAEEVASRKK